MAQRPKKPRKTARRPARRLAPEKKKYATTYAVPARVARIAIELLLPPQQLSYAQITDVIGCRVSERTIDRYVSALRGVFDGHGRYGLLEIEKYEGRKVLFLRKPAGAEGDDGTEQLRTTLALEMLAALKGTHLENDVNAILKRFAAAMPRELGPQIEALPRKFHAITYGVKRYEGAARERIDLLVRCVVEQQRTRVAYRSQESGGELNEYEFDPYTLATYKGGLYAIGYSFRREKVVPLAVERIEKIEAISDERGQPYLFRYPDEYSPQKFTEGCFGIFRRPNVEDVELVIRSATTLGFLKPRSLHPTQKLVERGDGTAVLTMSVRGTEEVASWVMSMAPWVEVVKPAELRERVKGMLQDGLRLYS